MTLETTIYKLQFSGVFLVRIPVEFTVNCHLVESSPDSDHPKARGPLLYNVRIPVVIPGFEQVTHFGFGGATHDNTASQPPAPATATAPSANAAGLFTTPRLKHVFLYVVPFFCVCFFFLCVMLFFSCVCFWYLSLLVLTGNNFTTVVCFAHEFWFAFSIFLRLLFPCWC